MHDLETLVYNVETLTRPETWKKPHFSTSRKQMGPRYRPTYATLSRTSRASSKSVPLPRHPPMNARFALRVKNGSRYNARIDFPFLSFPYLFLFSSLPLFRAIRDPVEKHATPCASIHNIRARYILKTRPLPRYVNGRSKRETKRKTTTGRRRPIPRSQIHSNYLCRVLRVHRWSCLIPPCATSNTENKARGRRAERETLNACSSYLYGRCSRQS